MCTVIGFPLGLNLLAAIPSVLALACWLAVVLAAGLPEVRTAFVTGKLKNDITIGIPQEDLASYGHLAGIVVVMDDYGKWLITTYKKRALESELRRPYAQDRVPWQSYLADGRPN